MIPTRSYDPDELIDEHITVADAAQPDETVRDRLRAAGDCEAMLALLRGSVSEEHMTYEDWVHPLKLTGGKVCLRHDGQFDTGWTRRRSDGMLEGMTTGGPPGTTGPNEVSPIEVKSIIRRRGAVPVRVEDTPFGGEDE